LSLLVACFCYFACAAPEAVGRRPWPATTTLPQRWIDSDQKAQLKQLAEA
jgi:hypothetical protein